MKKIFLMSFLMLALLSVFAVTAFAEDIVVSKTENEEYGTVIQLNADPGIDNAKNYVSTLNKIVDAGTDSDALCILTDGDAENPTYYVFPSSYIVDEREDGRFDIVATALADAMAEFNTANGTSYFADYAIAGSGADKRINSVVRFVFPSSVLSAKDTVCRMREYPNLVEIRINHAIDFSSATYMFYKNSKLETVMGFENVDGTKLSKTMFASCSALRYIKLPANTTKIPGSFFQGAKGVNVVNMAELTELTTIDSWAFDGTHTLVITLPDSVTTLNASAFASAFKYGGSITINPTSQLTTIGNNAFSDNAGLSYIYIPSTVNKIGTEAFKSCGITTLDNFENCQITTIRSKTFDSASKLTSIKIPKTVTTIENAFLGNKSLTRVYIPDTVTSIADTFVQASWSEAPTNVVFVYIGKDTELIYNCAIIAGANVIPAMEYSEAGTYTGVNLVIGYSNCVVYNNGVHENNISDTVVTSYLEEINIVKKCVDCGMYDTTGKISALFTCQGYSAPEVGLGGIVIGYMVNSEAIAQYEELADVKLNFGVFAVSQSKLGEKDIFDENGVAATGTINVEIKNREFAMFELKIIGFTDEQKDSKLAMGAYVVVADAEKTEYYYLQTNAPTQGKKYYFASYNEMVAELK